MSDDEMELHIEYIEEKGAYVFWTQNFREDLLEDHRYFLDEAKKHPPKNVLERSVHRRFLRASFLAFYAYAEGVLNCWLHSLLRDRQDDKLTFRRVERECLKRKMKLVESLSGAKVRRTPDLSDPKKLRNRIEHFAPESDASVLDEMTLEVVENVALSFDGWMSVVEGSTDLVRHPVSEDFYQEAVKRIDEIKTRQGNV